MMNTIKNMMTTKLGQELNRDIVEEVKLINARLTSGELTDKQVTRQLEVKKELNKQRISALNLKLIQGGKT